MNFSVSLLHGFRVLALLSLSLAVHGVRAESKSPPAPASVDELRTRLEAHVGQPRFKEALWGVKIVSLDSGQTLFEHHSDRLLSPASNCKLYTGALALDQLGGDYRIVTPIYATAKPDAAGELKGDVIVSGRGDPSWKVRGSKREFWSIFDPMIAVLEKAGVRHVTGDLVADATWFVGVPYGAGWTADDLNDYYGAEVSAVSLQENYAELRLTPAATVGAPCTFALVLPGTGLVVDNRTKTSAKDGKPKLEVVRLIGENVVHVFGEVPMGEKEETVDVTVPRPASWFAAAFKEALARKGIKVDGQSRSLRWPDAPAVNAGSVKLGDVSSPPLRELVTTFMKPSQNLETDLIFDHLGESRRTADTPGTRTTEEIGVSLLKDFLKKNGLPADEVRFEEGSGLSRNNLASANATVALLKFMATHREGAGYLTALPIAGVDGSLRKRMKGTVAEGKVHAKTGTLRYANSLSGYVTTAAGERLAFGLMLNRNTQPAPGRGTRDELDDIAVMLAGLTGRSDGK